MQKVRMSFNSGSDPVREALALLTEPRALTAVGSRPDQVAKPV